MAADALGGALRACPFLSRVAEAQGEGYARRLAHNPFASASAGPLLLEEGLSNFAATLRLFHGPGGVVPLRRFAGEGAAAASTATGATCPFRAAAAAAVQADAQPAAGSSSPALEQRAAAASASPAAQACGQAAAASAAVPAAAARQRVRAPLASISLSGFGFLPDPGQLLNKPPRPKRSQRRSQQQQQQRSPSDHASGGGRSAGAGGAASTSTSSTSAPSSGPGVSSNSGAGGRLQPGGPAAAAGGGGGGGFSGSCARFGRALGGLIPLAASGHLQCPAPIIKMRAAVASLKPVRQLRPQALPVRALAMGATAVAANLPCGAWREHTRKFSPQWFLAVHATIPFVAMLRKAVLMPKWAILLTIAGSIAGQNFGARMERKRLHSLASRRQQPGAAARGGKAALWEAPLTADSLVPSLEQGCRRCVDATRSAVAWALAPTVVQ